MEVSTALSGLTSKFSMRARSWTSSLKTSTSGLLSWQIWKTTYWSRCATRTSLRRPSASWKSSSSTTTCKNGWSTSALKSSSQCCGCSTSLTPNMNAKKMYTTSLRSYTTGQTNASARTPSVIPQTSFAVSCTSRSRHSLRRIRRLIRIQISLS